MPEAAVILTGQIADIAPQFSYDNATNSFTTDLKGYKILVAAPGARGFARVSITLEHFTIIQPQLGASVCWLIRYGAWARNDTAQTSVNFVAVVGPDEVDRVISFSGVTSK
jgi:hypothetical protein